MRAPAFWRQGPRGARGGPGGRAATPKAARCGTGGRPRRGPSSCYPDSSDRRISRRIGHGVQSGVRRLPLKGVAPAVAPAMWCAAAMPVAIPHRSAPPPGSALSTRNQRRLSRNRPAVRLSAPRSACRCGAPAAPTTQRPRSRGCVAHHCSPRRGRPASPSRARLPSPAACPYRAPRQRTAIPSRQAGVAAPPPVARPAIPYAG